VAPFKGPSDDYVQVNERIVRFIEKFPDGSLQSEIVELTNERVVIRGIAYRNPDDPKPGVGHSWLEIPGKTPFTRGSEIENAETSAWGRALAALGFEVKRGIASLEEVRNKRIEGEVETKIESSEVAGVSRGGRTDKANPIQIRQAKLLSRELDLGTTGFREAIDRIMGTELEPFDDEDEAAKKLVAYLEDLSRDDIGTLIQGLSAEVEARNGQGQGDREPAEESLAGSV
jgi:hypothetical protein